MAACTDPSEGTVSLGRICGARGWTLHTHEKTGWTGTSHQSAAAGGDPATARNVLGALGGRESV